MAIDPVLAGVGVGAGAGTGAGTGVGVGVGAAGVGVGAGGVRSGVGCCWQLITIVTDNKTRRITAHKVVNLFIFNAFLFLNKKGHQPPNVF
jgi:hypothetical protein